MISPAVSLPRSGTIPLEARSQAFDIDFSLPRSPLDAAIVEQTGQEAS
jgi:hypothetical protein